MNEYNPQTLYSMLRQLFVERQQEPYQEFVQDNVYQQHKPYAKGFGRPYVMSLQEYVDNYLPHYGLNYQDIPQEELPQR